MACLLSDFLSRQRPLAEESAAWCGGSLPLRIASYLCDEQPPLDFVTSVRAVVLRADSVLVVRDGADSFHVTPGGRREEGESIEATLRREVLEETGWALAEPAPLGFLHFRHLAPRPEGYAYPYPDFVQLIFVARAAEFVPEARQPGEYEIETGFRPSAEARKLSLTPSQRLFLDAAFGSRGAG